MKFDSNVAVKGKQIEVWRKTPTLGALCLGFAPEAQIYRCLEQFGKEDFRGDKLLLDLSFPGNRPLAFPGWRVERIKNQGTGRNWNNGWRLLCCPTRVVGVEPDEIPSEGWVGAAMRLMDSQDIGYVACTMASHHPKYIEHFKLDIQTINGVRCVEFPRGSPTPWPCGVFHSRLLSQGMECNGYYGALEPIMQEKAYKNGLRVLHMPDYTVEHLRGTDEYEEWKQKSGDNETKETFEAWLRNKTQVSSQTPLDAL